MSRRGWALFCVMCVVWGVPYLLIKVSVGDLSPPTLVFLRTGIGAVLLVPLALARGQLRPVPARWRPLLAYTVAEIAVPWLLLSDAERRLSSSLSGLLVATVPLIVAVFGFLGASQDRPDLRRTLGLLIGLGGVAALLGLDVTGGDLGAVAEVGVVAVGYAIGPLMIARSLAGLPSLGVVAASLGLTAVGYAPAGILGLPAHWPSAKVVASVLVLGVVCTALAFLLFFALIAETGPIRATVITYVNPAVAVGLGVALLGEAFSAGTALGFVLIIGGCILATRRSKARATPGPSPPEDLVAETAR